MVDGYLFLAGRRIKRESAEHLALGTLASRGKQEAVRKKLKELTKD